MALGKYSRVDGRRSSSCCSTVTLVGFVALCLVGVWMMTSSTVSPIDMSTTEKSDTTEDITQIEEKTFEDGSGDVSGDGTKGNNNRGPNILSEENNPDVYQSQDAPEKESEIKEDETPVKKSDQKKKSSDDVSNGQIYNSENENKEGSEKNKDPGQGDRQEQQQNSEQKNIGTDKIEEEKSSDVGQNTNDDNKKNEDENSPSNENVQDEKSQDETEQKVEEIESKDLDSKDLEQDVGANKTKDQGAAEMLPDPAQSELLNETSTQTGSWSTQAAESKNEKEKQKSSGGQTSEFRWKLCKSTAGPDFIPCLDNEEAIAKLPSTKHYEHRERHCPEEGPTCLVPLPEGYKRSIKWPQSRDKIWYANVPHTKLAVVKGHQNWVKATGEYLTFPGGGTQFKHGALHYIDFIQESLSDIAWGNRTRVILDVGCGVASFGGFLFDRDVLAMSLAPKDEHEAQVQFALERGIPAISAVMGTKRLPFPGRVFDVVHCARCRVPWHIEGGKLLLELNRLLRPGGYFVWSATPIYQKLPEDVEIWEAMSALIKSICWEMVSVTKDSLNGVGVAIYRKPTSNECYEKRTENNPPLCKDSDDPNAAWNVKLQACMHRVPVDPSQRGSQWPQQWPNRLETAPYWLNSSQIGVYGQAAPEDFKTDYEHWKHVVSKSYLTGIGIDWTNIRNVMDMRAVYGGFAAALRDMNVWVMNVVSIDSADTLPIIYERGLFGIYHDWCKSFSTYPRTYDLVHADHLFSKVKKRCKLLSVMAEVDRILRPQGKLIVRDDMETTNELENIAKSLHWGVRMTYSKEKEGLLCLEKKMWRPQEVEAII